MLFVIIVLLIIVSVIGNGCEGEVGSGFGFFKGFFRFLFEFFGFFERGLFFFRRKFKFMLRITVIVVSRDTRNDVRGSSF